jgi:probable phosphoglycerate mutase
MGHPTLYFVRHGETDWNAEGRLQGQTEIPLNPLGQRQADGVGQVLREMGATVDHLPFIGSPMVRARETMERLRRSMGLDPAGYVTDDRLKELSFGEWEGLTWKDVRRTAPGGAARREADKWGFVPPGGESYAMLSERVGAWLEEQRGDAVVVAHGGVARALLHLITGLSPEVAPVMDIWQGRVLLIREGTARWNGTGEPVR